MKPKQLLVFIVDDDAIYALVAAKTIKATDFDCEVIVCHSTRDCLSSLKEREETNEKLPDYIFIDLNMPEMNGWEFIESLKKSDGELLEVSKIYLMSSTQSETDLQKAETNRLIEGFLEKPILKEQFAEIFSQL